MSNSFRFSVKDTGPGISSDILPYIFNRFWQARKTEQLGSGLGLAIAKGIVEAHKGTIVVQSKLGEGSLFYFDLPKRSDAEIGKAA
jgi:signal transduction histidine kinase